MIRNYSILDNIGFEFNGLSVDIHNNYVLSELIIELEKNKLILIFTKLSMNWVGADQPNTLKVVFEKVNYIKLKGDLLNFSGQGLDFIGYLNTKDGGKFNEFLYENDLLRNETYDLIFSFDDFALRILSETSFVIIDKD